MGLFDYLPTITPTPNGYRISTAKSARTIMSGLAKTAGDYQSAFFSGAKLPEDYQQFDTLNAFKNVELLYACVHKRAKAVGQLPVDLMYRGKALPPDKWPEYLNGSGYERFKQLRYRMVGCALLTGEAYAGIHTNKQFIPEGLQFFIPGAGCKPIWKNGILDHFERSAPYDRKRWEIEEIVYHWLPNLTGEAGPGTPPAQPILKSCQLIFNAAKLAEGWFARGHGPRAIIEVKGASHEQIKEIEEWTRRQNRGVDNFWNTVGSDGETKIHEAGSIPQGLAMSELITVHSKDIIRGMEIPDSIIMSSAATYAANITDRYEFQQDVVTEDAERFYDDFNRFMETQGLQFVPRPERSFVTQQFMLENSRALQPWYARKVVTGGEVRESMGKDKERPKPEAWEEDIAAAAPPPTFPPNLTYTPPEKWQSILSEGRKWKNKVLKDASSGDPDNHSLVKWKNENITTCLAVHTKRMTIQHGLDVGFAWTKDIQDVMSADSDRIAKKVKKDLALLEGLIAAGLMLDPPKIDYAPFTKALEVTALDELSVVMMERAGSAMAAAAVPLDLAALNDVVLDWLPDHAYELSRGCTATTQKSVDKVIQKYFTGETMTLTEREEAVTGAIKRLHWNWSENRAEQIAVTEVTAANSAAINIYQKEVFNQSAIILRRRWNYTWSGSPEWETPCPICGPLDGVYEDEYGMFNGEFSDSPAHVKCYCNITLEPAPSGWTRDFMRQ